MDLFDEELLKLFILDIRELERLRNINERKGDL